MSKSPSLRRIQADIRELALDPSDRYHAAPLENDMHFTIRGADDTDFAGGVYHGRILLPPEYPFKPPHIMFLTPTGRFETHTKICLSFSAFHPELWQPAWGIRLILEALISFLPTPADGAIGALDWSSKERKAVAKKSVDYSCPLCGKIVDLLPKKKETTGEKNNNDKPNRFQKEIEELQRFQRLEHQQEEEDQTEGKQEESTKDADDDKEAQAQKEDTKQDDDVKEQEKKDVSNVVPKEEEKSKLKDSSVSPEPASESRVEKIHPENEEKEEEVNNSKGDKNEPTTQIEEVPPPREEEPLINHPPQLPVEIPATQPSSQGLWDPLLQTAMILLSVLCFLLVRKLNIIMKEIEALEQ